MNDYEVIYERVDYERVDYENMEIDGQLVEGQHYHNAPKPSSGCTGSISMLPLTLAFLAAVVVAKICHR